MNVCLAISSVEASGTVRMAELSTKKYSPDVKDSILQMPDRGKDVSGSRFFQTGVYFCT